jgi:hypothetical protein
MANEVTVAASIEFDNDVTQASCEVKDGDTIRSMTTAKALKTTQAVGTSEEAVLLGDITAPCGVMLINLDSTNYIEVKVATGGAIFAKLYPRGSGVGLNFCIVPLGSGAQAPFVIANTASCSMEILLLSL